jgi:aminoglycoside phosphotransferase (APT) family kinase protein
VAEWDAEVAIDDVLVRALLADQFPELDAASLRLLGEGWDYSVWVLEERWAFRFPRREVVLPGLERELAVLPRIAPLLPLPIPTPTFVGRPSERFPWPFFGAPFIPGREPAEAALDDADRAAVGAQLGRFLRVLHDIEVEVDLPVDPIRRADMPFRVVRAREKLEAVSPIWRVPRDVHRVLNEAEHLPPSTDHSVTHGDLHLRQILIDGRSLSGVIDWVDVSRSDPAIDLMLVWSLLPPEARERFEAVYGPVDEESKLRARVLALFMGATLAVYAREAGHESLEQECVAGLDRTLVEWD